MDVVNKCWLIRIASLELLILLLELLFRRLVNNLDPRAIEFIPLLRVCFVVLVRGVDLPMIRNRLLNVLIDVPNAEELWDLREDGGKRGLQCRFVVSKEDL